MVHTVIGSLRKIAPARIATAGLMYVMAVDRTGPTSPMRAMSRMKASALQITARTTIETITGGLGTSVGHPPVISTIGTYTIAAPASETATTPMPGRSDIHLDRIAGPSA